MARTDLRAAFRSGGGRAGSRGGFRGGFGGDGGSAWWGKALFGLAIVVVVLVTWLLTAPATLADWALGKATAQRIRIADATGSIWNGKGRLVIVDVDGERDRRERAADNPGTKKTSANGGELLALAGVPIPGTISWKIDPWPLLLGRLEATARHDSMASPVTLNGNTQALQIGPGAMQLPSISLDRLGSPWSAVKPVGSLGVSWQQLRVARNGFEGKLVADLRDASSALTTVRPLGAWRLEVDAKGPAADLRMVPLEGPLRLSGTGNWTARGGLRFQAEAEADESERLRLQSLLGLLGRREGNRTIIRIGA